MLRKMIRDTRKRRLKKGNGWHEKLKGISNNNIKNSNRPDDGSDNPTTWGFLYWEGPEGDVTLQANLGVDSNMVPVS